MDLTTLIRPYTLPDDRDNSATNALSSESSGVFCDLSRAFHVESTLGAASMTRHPGLFAFKLTLLYLRMDHILHSPETIIEGRIHGRLEGHNLVGVGVYRLLQFVRSYARCDGQLSAIQMRATDPRENAREQQKGDGTSSDAGMR